MPTQAHPLESFYHQSVQRSFVDRIGLNDPEIIDYVTRMLCEFSDSDNLHRLKDATGRRIENIVEMVRASDPVFGTAPSFDAERSVRRYIGDYAMFIAGTQLDAVESAPNYRYDRSIVNELIRLGRESYFIVSQFDLFEYEKDAPLFARLAESIDRCVLGLALVRDQLNARRALGAAQI